MLKSPLADEWRSARAVGPARGSGMAPDLAAGQPGCHMRFGGFQSNPAARPSVCRALGSSVANSTSSRRRTIRRRLGQQVRGQAADLGTEDHRWPPIDDMMNRVPANAVLLAVAPDGPNRNAPPGRVVPRSGERRPRRCRGLHRPGSQPPGREGRFAEAGVEHPLGHPVTGLGWSQPHGESSKCCRPMFADAVVPGAVVHGAAGALGRLPGAACLGLRAWSRVRGAAGAWGYASGAAVPVAVPGLPGERGGPEERDRVG